MLKEKRYKLKLLTYNYCIVLVIYNVYSYRMNEKEFHLFISVFIYLIKLSILNINTVIINKNDLLSILISKSLLQYIDTT